LFLFAACYIVVLVLEIVRLRGGGRKFVPFTIGMAALGLIIHTVYLIGEQRGLFESGPISSWHQWYLMAAWVVAMIYLISAIGQPDTSQGLFLIPLVLLLTAVGYSMDQVSGFNDSNSATDSWGLIHGVALLAGTVVVLLGFASGVMFLIQSYRLKHKMLSSDGFRLPSLEWLESTNRKALSVSTGLLASGLFAGILLRINNDSFPWSDPVIWSSAILFLWLISATTFEIFYRPARQGRKVAYLTMANFVFLAVVLGLVLFGPSQHAKSPQDPPEQHSIGATVRGYFALVSSSNTRGRPMP